MNKHQNRIMAKPRSSPRFNTFASGEEICQESIRYVKMSQTAAHKPYGCWSFYRIFQLAFLHPNGSQNKNYSWGGEKKTQAYSVSTEFVENCSSYYMKVRNREDMIPVSKEIREIALFQYNQKRAMKF